MAVPAVDGEKIDFPGLTNIIQMTIVIIIIKILMITDAAHFS